jgi:hypothetical protein
MSWLVNIFRAIFGPSVGTLVKQASVFGRIRLEQSGIEHRGQGVLGWVCTIRAHERSPDEHRKESHPQFSWRGEGVTLEDALVMAIEEVKDLPSTARIAGDHWAPRLGGKRFDE